MAVLILAAPALTDHTLLAVASWVVPLVLLPFAIGFATTFTAGRLALAGENRDEHWSVLARRLYPARIVVAVTTWLTAAVCSWFAIAGAAMLYPRPSAVAGLLAASAAWLGATRAGWTLFRSVRPPTRYGTYVRDQAAQAAILIPHLLVCVGIGVALSATPAVRIAAVGAGVAAWVAFAVIGGAPIARALGRLAPASPKLADAVARAAARVGRTPRSVSEIDLPMANAFANPVTQRIYFTRQAVDALSEEEIEAVAAHEIGHLIEPRSVVWIRVAANLTLLPIVFIPTLVSGLGWLGGLGASYAAMIALFVPVRRLQRRMEERADRAAACHESQSRVFATALERLGRLNLAPAVGSRQGTHPDLYDRMIAAGVEPDFPRPARPSRLRGVSGLAAALAVSFLAYLLHASPGRSLELVIPDPIARAYAEIAITGGSRASLYDLALAQAGRPADALATTAFLVAELPRDPSALALHAWALALNERCAEAHARLGEATELEEARGGDFAWIGWAGEVAEGCLDGEPVEE